MDGRHDTTEGLDDQQQGFKSQLYATLRSSGIVGNIKVRRAPLH